MSLLFSYPGTIQYTFSNLSLDQNSTSQLSTSRFIPDIFRYFPPEITGQTNPFTGQIVGTCENRTYLEALYCDNPYAPLIIYPFRQTLVDRVISLVPLRYIDDALYLNQNNLLEKLVQLVRVSEQNNQVFTGGSAVSCANFYITWDATYDWNPVSNVPIPASAITLTFYELVGAYQTCFVNYTVDNMYSDYMTYKNTTNNLLNNPLGYILQRTIFIYNQILTYCEQGLAGKTAYLPQEYIDYWNVPSRQRLFVEKYRPDYYYGNIYVAGGNLNRTV